MVMSGITRRPWLPAAAAAVAALIVAACGSSSLGQGGTARALGTTTIDGATVLTNAQGFTLYSFAPDTATTSKCNAGCVQIWPPLPGPIAVGPGVADMIGTIKRADGATQATRNGHPLYTYAGDTRPGQANGNNLNLNGGRWHEVTVSGRGHRGHVPVPGAR